MAQDPMSMFSQIWSGATVPLMMNPEQLDKKIDELRLVQSWLKINLQMLDASLAAMEMQRDTRRQFQTAFQNMSTSASSMSSTPSMPNMPQDESKVAPSPSVAADSSSPTVDSLAMPAFDDLSAWWQNLGQEFLSSLKVAPEPAVESTPESVAKSAPKKPAPKKSAPKKSEPKSV